ncbi:hypothetical protein [Streptomyces sp. NPDC001889]
MFAALGLLTGCTTGGGGVKDEGSAQAEAVANPNATGPDADGAPKDTSDVDPVKLIKNDPEVDARVKAGLKPCTRGDYPIDTTHGNMTGGAVPDVVVNVMTCADGVGLGTYVYRASGTTYENVFTSEEPAVYANIDRGDLVVTRPVYTERDPVASPSVEEITTYHWSDGRFTKLHWVRNELGRTADEDEFTDPEPTDPPPSEN